MSEVRFVKSLSDDKHNVSCIVFTPDGRIIASGGYDHIVRLHNIYSGELAKALKGHNGVVLSIAISSDGRNLISGSSDNTARVWLMESCTEIRKLQHHSDVYGVALSPDNQLIITSTGHTDYAVCVWRKDDGGLVHRMNGHTDVVSCVTVTLDGLHVVSGSYDLTARVWQLSYGTLQREIKHSDCVFSVAVTSDGQRIITGCHDGVVRLFLLTTGAQMHELRGHYAAVISVAISVNGRHVVSGSWDTTVRVWNLNNLLSRSLVLAGHTKSVSSVAFHTTGKQVASASDNDDDNTVRLWTACEWTDRDHQLFGQKFKALVFFLMCVKAKLDVLFEEDNQSCFLPRLPMAVWLQVFAFLSEQDN